MCKRPGLWGLLISGVCASALTAPAAAQFRLPTVTFEYIMPEDIDPNVVLTFTNPTAPLTATGAQLILPPNPPPGAVGAELHSALPGGLGGLLDVIQVRVDFDYDGMVIIDSQGRGSYLPWTGVDQGSGSQHILVFTVASLTGSAPINNNFDPGAPFPFRQSFAGVTVKSPTGGVPTDFAGVNVMFTATATGQERFVPEPGTTALLSGFLVGAGWPLLHQKRRMRSSARRGTGSLGPGSDRGHSTCRDRK